MTRLDCTSKIALKTSCLQACSGDVKAARELYVYMTEDLSDLPDMPPVQPDTMQRIKAGADEVVGWLSNNKDIIAQGIALVRGVTDKVSVSPSVPPIPTEL